ncbi:MAG: thiamine pyrophosphate-dependent enzyme [Betaproteobacteria bacterium]
MIRSIMGIPSFTAAQAVVASLEANGITELFCLPGIQNDPFFDALFDSRVIRPIQTRHEQGAGYMALGAALATGRPSAFCVVPGPGWLNTTAAMATAYAVNAPVLAIVGQIPQRLIGRGLGMLHELPDQLGTLRLLTKWAARIESAAAAPEVMAQAFAQLTGGRRRPVAIECPLDVWGASADGPLVRPAATVRSGPPLDDDAIEKAARVVGRATRPLVVVGGGAQHASAQVRAIAELLQAPVTAYRAGKGVLDARHPLWAPFPAGHALWADADVVLAVGTRLQIQQMEFGVDQNLAIVRIDIDEAELARIHAPAVGIVGDAAEALARLADGLPAHMTRRTDRVPEIRGVVERTHAELARQFAPQMAYLNAIRAALPEDGIFVDDLTQVGYVGRSLYPAYGPHTYLSAGYQGTLGWGYAAALGAKAARPDAPVVSIGGDGGFMFNVQELATAVHHRLGVVAIVFNDNAYGNVRRIQQQRYRGRVIASDLTNPDFVAMADSFGVAGERVASAGGLREVLAQAIARDRPALIEVPIGEMPDPWPLIHPPRNRG